MKVMVTGHRPQRLHGNESLVRAWFDEKIKELKPDECISGMAEGADQIWAECVIKAGIPLLAYLPWLQDLKKMSAEKQDLLKQAASLNFTSLEWSKQCYTIRDRAMVDDSDVVLVVWDGQKGGGTYYTMEYAKKKGKEMYILNVSNK